MSAALAVFPCVGIMGSFGAYGRWLAAFFHTKMGLKVIGYDPADPDSYSLPYVLEHADVLVFSAPIRRTKALIADCVRQSAGRERGRLWLDVTSIKAEPVAAMLASQASVVGLHPMTAPPKAPTLKGRVLVVCSARIEPHWQAWLVQLYDRLEAQCVQATPEHHDRVMALVQAMVHATHLAQAGVLRHYAPLLGELRALLPYRSTGFALDTAIITRILAQNPAIYEDIQFCNPYSAEVLDHLLTQLQQLRQQLQQGDESARQAFNQQFLHDNRQAIDEMTLQEGNYCFERLGYLLGDLSQPQAISVHLPIDDPGSLRKLLHVFEKHQINLSSIHSSRTPAGELHFRIGFEPHTALNVLAAATNDINHSGLGRVLEQAPVFN